MLKESIVIPADRCGVYTVKIFHVYQGFSHKIANVGSFSKISVRKTAANNWVKKKSKHKSIIIRTKFINFFNDGSFIFFKRNNLIILKKRLTTKGKELKGPVLRKIRRKKFLASFPASL